MKKIPLDNGYHLILMKNGQFILYIYLYKVSFKGKKKQQFKDLNKKL